MPQTNRISMLPFWEEAGGFNEFLRIPEDKWNELCSAFGIKPERADRNIAIQRARSEALLMERYNIKLLCYDDHLYPSLLSECPDAPLVLYYKGTLYPDHDILAIVGTRAASYECKNIISEIVEKIAKCTNPPIIVSGLAYGIDVCAQKAAVENGLLTYSVVAHGLGTIYPSANRDIAKEIINKNIGAILSEYPSNMQPQKHLFLERNRIIAGMARWLLVGESGLKGGSMVTAKIAFSYGREIMSIPGSPLNKSSQGCNQLIKHNMAYLIEGGNDVIDILNLQLNSQSDSIKYDKNTLTIEEGIIIGILEDKNAPLHLNEIQNLSGISHMSLPYILLNLEINSLIYALPGNFYKIRK